MTSPCIPETVDFHSHFFEKDYSLGILNSVFVEELKRNGP